MSNFTVISKKFYNEFRNGSAFGDNLTEFTDRLQGNKGEIVQILEQIEIATIVNESQAIQMQFLENSAGSFAILFAPVLDFVDKGFYNGAALQIEFDGNVITTATCDGVSGSGNSFLKIDSTGRTALLAAGLDNEEERFDIVIKVTSAPTYLTYLYGLNPSLSEGANNYDSPYGGQQNYQLQGITGSFQSMLWVGSLNGSDLGTARLKFDTTEENFRHQFTIEHTFKLPYYIQGQQTNLNGVTNPSELLGANTLKYVNGFFFGGTTNVTVAQFEDQGGVGNVGYFDENFNGFTNNYVIENFAISNASATGTLEGTLQNIVTFDIKNNLGNWSGGEEFIFTHSKLPTQDEYNNQNTAFDTTWLFENLRQFEGAGAVTGTILSAFVLTIDGGDPTLINATLRVTFSAAQQLLIDEGVDFLLYLTTATQNLSNVNTVDRVNLVVDQETYTNNNDVVELVTGWIPEILNHWDFSSGTEIFTNFNGWDGDLLGIKFRFSTDVTRNAIVKSFKLQVVADNGTEQFPLFTQSIPINRILTVQVDSFFFQVINKDLTGAFNFPIDEDLNQLELSAFVPPSPAPNTQAWSGRLGFRVPWRDWIENLSVDPVFVDYAEPNDNFNEKTSNYSGLNGYSIYCMIELNVGSNAGVDTIYKLFSDASAIVPFDDAASGTFSAVTILYDAQGDVTDNLFIDDNVRIEIEFTHTLGTILVADLWGRIWIEPDQTTLQPWDLSTHKDFTDGLNPLQVTDTLTTGNTEFVEIVSINNKVTLICQTNKDNLTNGTLYNVYGRLGTTK